MYLGIDQQSGLVYEGIGSPTLPVVPRAIVTQAKLIKNENDWNELPAAIAHSPTSWVFREDAFDPVTRTKRGRLYEAEPSQPATYWVMPDPYEDPFGRTAGRVVALPKTYMPTRRVDRFYQNRTEVWG
jgi:hypothetical protein